jgi:hypothetical protein
MKNRGKIAMLAAAGCLLFLADPGSSETNRSDPASRMFSWWNEAIKSQDKLSPAEFERYYTRDAVLRIDGVDVSKGVEGLSRHFRAISANGGQVVIELPFEEVFANGSRLFTEHLIYSNRNGVETCLLAAGHVEMRSNKISRVSLVRTKLPEGGDLYRKCLKNRNHE